MTIKLLSEHHTVFLSLKRGCKACQSLHLLKCHIVGNNMSRLILSCLEGTVIFRSLAKTVGTAGRRIPQYT